MGELVTILRVSESMVEAVRRDGMESRRSKSSFFTNLRSECCSSICSIIVFIL